MVSTTQQLLDDVESLKNILVSRSRGGVGDNHEYVSLRMKLIKNTQIKDRLPRFIRTCRNLDEFWPFIKEKESSYAGRQRYLADEFDSVLSFLEQQAETPSDELISDMLKKVDSPHVAAAWQKALDRRLTDPTGAITSARSLIETVCKHILEEEGVEYSDKDDLPKIYAATAKSLNLAPAQHSEDVFKKILGGCHSVVEGLGALRNRHGDSHGTGKKGVKPAPRHAELAVNLAGTMATFLLATWESQGK